MPIVPQPPFRAPKQDDDVCPPTPFGPGKEWPATHELMVGVGDLRDLTPEDPELEFVRYDPPKFLHPGPLGFAPPTSNKKKR